jgi:hypothetical protein
MRAKGVAFDQLKLPRLELSRKPFTQIIGKTVIELDREKFCASGQQRFGQCARTWADLQDTLARLHACISRDGFKQCRVN